MGNLRRDDEEFMRDVRSAVREMVANGDVSIVILASSVGLARRTLQRRLKLNGTSYSQLLDEARRERALTSLASGDLSMHDLATSVSYRRPSTLTRAVKRWTGQTPSRYRRALGAGPDRQQE